MRQFVEFSRKEEGTKLEVHCYNLDPRGGVDEIINMLSQRGFAFTFINSDSVSAERQGNYDEVIKHMTELKGKGFSWDID